jgi:hypothetical protein
VKTRKKIDRFVIDSPPWEIARLQQLAKRFERNRSYNDQCVILLDLDGNMMRGTCLTLLKRTPVTKAVAGSFIASVCHGGACVRCV